jgi:lipopolysaccharide transport system ATP-binding protein
LEGVRILTFDTDLRDDRRDFSEGFRGVVDLRVDRLDLQPARYVVDIGARSGHATALDYLPSFAEIEVIPGPDTPSLIVREDGGVRVPAAVTWAADAVTRYASDVPA